MPKAPSIIGDPAIKQQGSSVFLETVVEGDPIPSVKWFKDETEVKEGSSYKISASSVTPGKCDFKCEIVNFDKPLAGIYKAKFTSPAGETAATFTVSAGDAPEFVEKPKIVQKDGGKILGIKAHAKSKEDPTISWLKDDKPVVENDRVKATKKKVEGKPEEYLLLLEIKGPAKEDEGNYKCVVKNKDGQNSQSLRLAFD